MAHKMMPVALHQSNWKPGHDKRKKDDKPQTSKQKMQSFLRTKKGR